jgi:hypothetical protein
VWGWFLQKAYARKKQAGLGAADIFGTARGEELICILMPYRPLGGLLQF